MTERLFYVDTSDDSAVSLQFSNVIESGKAVGRDICITIEEDGGTIARAFFDKWQAIRLSNQLNAMINVLGGFKHYRE